MTNRSKRRSETAAVITNPVPVTHLIHRGHLAPSTARRMRHHRMRPRIVPRIARLIPGIDAIEPEINTTRFDKQRRDQHSPRIFRRSRPPKERLELSAVTCGNPTATVFIASAPWLESSWIGVPNFDFL